MNIRTLCPWEYEDVLPLADRFHSETQIGGTFDPVALPRLLNAARSTVIGLFDNKKLVGALVGILTPHFLTTDVMAQEILWYVEPEHRGCIDAAKMFTKFEEWAVAAGATNITMVALKTSQPSLHKLYVKHGYKPVETQYIKFFQ